MAKNIMEYDTVALSEEENAVVIIDQTKLPGKIELISLKTAQEIWDAIYLLQVRGAPAIGVTAAMGIYVLTNQLETDDFETFYSQFSEYQKFLDSSRPTAVNLSWAMKRMEKKALEAAERLRANRFTLSDYLDQMGQIKSMGDLGDIAGMLPGMDAKISLTSGTYIIIFLHILGHDSAAAHITFGQKSFGDLGTAGAAAEDSFIRFLKYMIQIHMSILYLHPIPAAIFDIRSDNFRLPAVCH